MKLCKTFEQIPARDCTGCNPDVTYKDGIEAANKTLPLEAIEEAMDALEHRRLAYVGYPREQEFINAIEQLLALIPGESDG